MCPPFISNKACKHALANSTSQYTYALWHPVHLPFKFVRIIFLYTRKFHTLRNIAECCNFLVYKKEKITVLHRLWYKTVIFLLNYSFMISSTVPLTALPVFLHLVLPVLLYLVHQTVLPAYPQKAWLVPHHCFP